MREIILFGKPSKVLRIALADLAAFMNERWKGMRPVAWGSTLSEAQLTTLIYEGLCGLKIVDS